MRFRIIDSTGDTVMHPADFAAASVSFDELMNKYMAYDASTLTILNKLTPENQDVIFHRKMVAG